MYLRLIVGGWWVFPYLASHHHLWRLCAQSQDSGDDQALHIAMVTEWAIQMLVSNDE